MLNRQSLRSTLKSLCERQSAENRQQAANAVAEQLVTMPDWKQVQNVGGYQANEREIDTTRIESTIFHVGKRLYLPVIQNSGEKRMGFYEFKANDPLQTNRFGIQEPVPKPSAMEFSATQLDWVLVPVLGVDRRGYRLGHGAGYYDRCFAFLNAKPRPAQPMLIGLGFHCQLIDNIEPNEWDVPLNALITEQGIHWFDV